MSEETRTDDKSAVAALGVLLAISLLLNIVIVVLVIICARKRAYIYKSLRV